MSGGEKSLTAGVLLPIPALAIPVLHARRGRQRWMMLMYGACILSIYEQFPIHRHHPSKRAPLEIADTLTVLQWSWRFILSVKMEEIPV